MTLNRQYLTNADYNVTCWASSHRVVWQIVKPSHWCIYQMTSHWWVRYISVIRLDICTCNMSTNTICDPLIEIENLKDDVSFMTHRFQSSISPNITIIICEIVITNVYFGVISGQNQSMRRFLWVRNHESSFFLVINFIGIKVTVP